MQLKNLNGYLVKSLCADITRVLLTRGARSMGWGFWLLLALDIVIGVGIFAGRNWLKANIERSVQHRFDARLESERIYARAKRR